MQDLDIVNLLMKLKKLESFYSLFLSENQKILMKYSKKNIIEENTIDDSSSDDDIHSEKHIKKFNEKTNDYDEYPALNSALIYFQCDMSQLNRKLLLSLLSKNPSRYFKHDHS